MRNKVVFCLCIVFLVISITLVTMQTSVDAYLGGYAFGANPALLDLDLDLDYLTNVAAQNTETTGLYGLYGTGGLYGLYGIGGLSGFYGLGTLPILNYLGYLYGTYGTEIGNFYSYPSGLSPSTWAGYGITYNPLFGYYQPLDLFGSMFALTNLFSWW